MLHILGKVFKTSFSDWILKLLTEIGCLAFLHSLRNKSYRNQMIVMKKLVTKNDNVKNKDHQDPIVVLKLSDYKLIEHP